MNLIECLIARSTRFRSASCFYLIKFCGLILPKSISTEDFISVRALEELGFKKQAEILTAALLGESIRGDKL